jgi:DNA uptake protein ComE-like DNA-binding protein
LSRFPNVWNWLKIESPDPIISEQAVANGLTSDGHEESARVAINTATIAEILDLPYIGEGRGKAIMSRRQPPFQDMDDFRDRAGISLTQQEWTDLEEKISFEL